MRIALYLTGTLLALLLLAFAVLFTPPGNDLLRPWIESKVADALKMDVELESFRLTPQRFGLTLLVGSDNRLEASGTYSALERSFKTTYRVRFDRLELFSALAGQPLQGVLHTDGRAWGDAEAVVVEGDSDLAQSKTRYRVEHRPDAQTRLDADIEHAEISELLHMLSRPPYLTGALSLTAHNLVLREQTAEGDVNLSLPSGRIDRARFAHDFNVTLPSTGFALNGTARLRQNAVDYAVAFDSQPLALLSRGRVVPSALDADLTYELDAKELALLRSVSDVNLQGPLKLSGSVKGDREHLLIKGRSDVAGSDTAFTLALEALRPASLSATVRGMRLARLQHMLMQPEYVNGRLDADIDLPSARMGSLKGQSSLSVREGHLVGKTLAPFFEGRTVPDAGFTLRSDHRFDGENILGETSLASKLADAKLSGFELDLASLGMRGDYRLSIPELGALAFATGRPLKGALEMHGDFRRDEQLAATAHADLAGGKMDARLRQTHLDALLSGIDTVKLLRMLTYPDLFASTLQGKLAYELDTRTGALDATLSNGRLAPKPIINTVGSMLKRDLYAERFNGTLHSDIALPMLTSTLSLDSNHTSIRTENARFDTDKQNVDARVDLESNRNPLSLKVSGNVHKPDVKIDASKLLQKEMKKGVDQLLKKLL